MRKENLLYLSSSRIFSSTPVLTEERRLRQISFTLLHYLERIEWGRLSYTEINTVVSRFVERLSRYSERRSTSNLLIRLVFGPSIDE